MILNFSTKIKINKNNLKLIIIHKIGKLKENNKINMKIILKKEFLEIIIYLIIQIGILVIKFNNYIIQIIYK